MGKLNVNDFEIRKSDICNDCYFLSSCGNDKMVDKLENKFGSCVSNNHVYIKKPKRLQKESSYYMNKCIELKQENKELREFNKEIFKKMDENKKENDDIYEYIRNKILNFTNDLNRINGIKCKILKLEIQIEPENSSNDVINYMIGKL